MHHDLAFEMPARYRAKLSYESCMQMDALLKKAFIGLKLHQRIGDLQKP